MPITVKICQGHPVLAILKYCVLVVINENIKPDIIK